MIEIIDDYDKGILYLTYSSENSINILEDKRYLIDNILDKYNIKYDSFITKLSDKCLFNVVKYILHDDISVHDNFIKYNSFLSGILDAKATISRRPDGIPRMIITHIDAQKIYRIAKLTNLYVGTQIYIYPSNKMNSLRIYWQSFDLIGLYHFLSDNSIIKQNLLNDILNSSLKNAFNKKYVCSECGNRFYPTILTKKYNKCPDCLYKDKTFEDLDTILYNEIADYFL